jgi:hypothetical protein
MDTKVKFSTFLFPLIALLLLATPAKALSISVSVTPTTILPGETVTISVFVDTAGGGVLAVIDPTTAADPYTGNPLTFPGTYSLTYPDDFTGGSTDLLGTYSVVLAIGGATYFAIFYVTFFVIPELPFGTILGVLAPTLAFAGLRIRTYKRRKE